MVKERIQYVCELCHKTFMTREQAEDCESRCKQLAESPRLEALNLSTRTFNLLYWFELYTVRDIAQMSEQDLLLKDASSPDIPIKCGYSHTTGNITVAKYSAISSGVCCISFFNHHLTMLTKLPEM